MNKEFSFSCAINDLSFGQTSIAILREMFSRGITPYIFPIGGQIGIASQKPDEVFNKTLQSCINAAPIRASRKHPSLKLWHIVPDSLSTYSSINSQLITFYECQNLQPLELNILRNQDKIYVTNKYTQSTFKQFGIESIYLPLGFDKHNFFQLEKRPKIDGAISFTLLGKAEKRKHTYRQLGLWAKRYGNRAEFRLNCSVSNGFLKPEHQNQLIAQALEGKQYWNISFLPFSATNAEYNQVLQSGEIVLCASGNEGFDLPAYHATALGAWPVSIRAHAMVDYLNDENAVLIKPNGMESIVDNIFFHLNAPTNQGSIFTFSDDDFYTACDKAIEKAKIGINIKGLELQKQTYKGTVDILLENLQ